MTVVTASHLPAVRPSGRSVVKLMIIKFPEYVVSVMRGNVRKFLDHVAISGAT